MNIEDIMETLNIEYTGKGSDKQIALAKSIFDADIVEIKNDYEDAVRRVNDGSMPEKWLQIWDEVLNDQRTLTALHRYASQQASETIDCKGFKTPRGGAQFNGIVKKLAEEKYQENKSMADTSAPANK